MNDLRVGAKLGFERLRGPSALVVLAIAGVVVFVAGVLERRSDTVSAADDVLSGVVFGIALPLLGYLVSERACAGQQLERSVDSVARYGADRRAAVVGVLLASALVTALGGAFLAVIALFGAHALSDSSLAFDLRSSVGIALLAGAVYALWFGAASLLGKGGAGRKWALIADFVFGAGSSAFAAPYPRAHLRNLLGGDPVLDLPQGSAWFALLAIGGACIAVSFVRTTE